MCTHSRIPSDTKFHVRVLSLRPPWHQQKHPGWSSHKARIIQRVHHLGKCMRSWSEHVPQALKVWELRSWKVGKLNGLKVWKLLEFKVPTQYSIDCIDQECINRLFAQSPDVQSFKLSNNSHTSQLEPCLIVSLRLDQILQYWPFEDANTNVKKNPITTAKHASYYSC